MRCCRTDAEPATPTGSASSTPSPSFVASSPAAAASISRRMAWGRRIVSLIKWALPITTLALIPKCPVCVAAYVLLFTGVGLSLSVATAMRWSFIALCIAALAYLLLRNVRRALMPRA